MSLRLCALFFLRFGNQRWEVYLYGRLWTSSFCGNGFLAIAFSFHTIWFPLFGVWPIFFGLYFDFLCRKGYAGRKSSHAIGRGEYYRIAVLYIILAISLRGTWIANCLLGALLWIINDLRPPVLEKRVTLVILTVAMIVLYRMPNYTVENYSDYLAWGMSSFLCLLVCFRVKVLKRILGFPLFSVLGKYAFELYLSHVIVMNACMGFLYAAWETYLSRPLLIWVGYGSCFVLSLLLAFGIKNAHRYCNRNF